MTPIRRISADFKELSALEVRCANLKCGAVFSIPIVYHLDENANCLGCRRRLWNGQGDKSYQRASGLMSMLYQWKLQEDILFSLGFSLNVDA
jgi:hypothetical protein